MKIRNSGLSSGLLLCTVLLQAQTTQSTTAALTVPRLVRVSNSFRPANGSAAAPVESVTFSIYAEEVGGSPLWQETQNVSIDGEGHYNVLLGSTRNDGVPADLFATGEPRWLGFSPLFTAMNVARLRDTTTSRR